MEEDPGVRREAVVQAVLGEDVDDVLGEQAPVGLGSQVVRRPIVFGVSRVGEEEPGFAVQLAAGEELESEIRMRGAAHPQVDLQGRQVPGNGGPVAPEEEVDGKAAYHPVGGEDLADALRVLLDGQAVFVASWEAAAEENLIGRAAQNL